MTSNRIKRNIFLIFSIIGLVVLAICVNGLIRYDGDWWSVIGAAILYGWIFDIYLSYRRKVRREQQHD